MKSCRNIPQTWVTISCLSWKPGCQYLFKRRSWAYWLTGWFFFHNWRGMSSGAWRKWGRPHAPVFSLGRRPPFFWGGGRGLPVSLLKWGDRRGGAGTGLKEQCSSNFTWKKWTFAWVGGSYRLTSASSCLWLFLAAWKTCLDSHGHGYVTKSGHSRTSSKSRQFPT